MAVNYSILTDVELNVKGIQKQLDKVKAKVKLDTSGAVKSIRALDDATAKSLLTYQASHAIFSKSVGVISSMVDQVYKLNSAQTEFRKVSDLTGKELDNYISKLSKMGKEVARSGSEMLDAATEFRKNSFNDQDSAQLAKISSMFQNVSDEAISASESASIIIAQMIAFADNSPEFATHIIDSINAVSNAYAVSSGEMARGLEVVASSSAAMDNSLEETLGLT